MHINVIYHKTGVEKDLVVTVNTMVMAASDVVDSDVIIVSSIDDRRYYCHDTNIDVYPTRLSSTVRLIDNR